MIVEFVRSGLPAWKRCFARMERSAEAYQRRRGGPTSTRSARPRVYGATQAKRLALLRCVAPRVVPVANRSKRGFDTAGHSISWEQIYAEWKKEHPDYPGSAEALERAYRRARHDRRVCELYLDGEFRDWAKQAEAVRQGLSSGSMTGLREEDLFVKTVPGNPRLAEDAHRMLAEAQALRRANEAEDVDPITRERNDTRAQVFEAAAQTLRTASRAKEWAVISPKLPPSAGRALDRAVKRNCGLTEDFVDYSREDVLCEGPGCHRCRIGADLLREGFISAPEGLQTKSADGATERHRQRLDESAQSLRKLFGSVDRRPRE